MKSKRRRHDSEFKARVSFEALKGTKTVQELAREYDLHSVQISDWKKVFAERMPHLFEKEAARGGPMGPSVSAAKNRSTGLSICSDTRLRLCGHTTRATTA
jgi:transposase-like protein